MVTEKTQEMQSEIKVDMENKHFASVESIQNIN